MNFKFRTISAAVSLAMITAMLPHFGAAADTVKAQTQFFEDFESYGITEKYNSSNMVYNAAPIDGVYDATVYPYGTASVYEGNAANNVTVLDYAGNTVAGGLDGWWGYLSGPDTNYNQWNRRLSVYKLTSSKVNASEINNTQFLKLEPKASATHTNGRAYFERQNVDLDGYSLLSTRINISGGIYEAGLAITMNPADQNAVALEVLTFTKAESGNVAVNFDGIKRAEIPLSKFNDGNALDWYTVEYRIYKNGDRARHSLLMVNDSTNEAVVDIDWMDMALTEYKFMWSPTKTYGIRYYVNATYGEGQTRLLLDDIKFTKESFTENFSGYNTKYTMSATTDDTSKRIVNAPEGNTNLSVYTNGVYEGSLQKNNYMYRTLADGTVEKVYGNVPFWQGYIADPSNNHMKDSQWNMRCNIIPAGSSDSLSLGLQKYYGYNNIIHLSPKSTATVSQAAYAGMESADFAEGTVWTTKMMFPNLGSGYTGAVKLQLTKGRSVTEANGASKSYDGNSHAAYLDVLEINTETGAISFAGEAIADAALEEKVKYEVAYTLDRTGEATTHSIKIRNMDDGTVVAQTEIKEISDASFFEGDIIGFRYAVTANASQNAKAVIRTVNIEKFFDNTAAGVPKNVSLELDTSKVIRNVPKEMYGINFEWGGQWGIYMTEDNSQINPSYIEAYKGIVPIARAAGGSSQVIDWKASVGDYSERGEQQFWHWDPSVLYYGPVEWINSVKAMMDGSSKFIYTINLPKPDGSGDSIEDIKDLVRFMSLMPDDENAVGSDGVNWAQKRIDCGISEPVDIYAWELGNELDLTSVGGYTVDQYLEMCEPVIAAINEIDPDAKLSMHTQTSKTSGWRDWHNKILTQVGGSIDYLSEHLYYEPALDNYYSTINDIISDISTAGYEDKIQLLVTEQAAMRTEGSGDGFGFRLPHTMKGVLSTSDFYTTMIGKTEVAAMNYHSIYSSSWCTSWPDENGTVHRTAIADLLEIYNKYGVGDAVECSISGFEYGQKTQMDVAAIKTDVGVNLIITNRNEVPTNLALGDTYTVNSSAKLYADSYKADKYKEYDDITYTTDANPEASVSVVEIPANSVIALELSTAPEATSIEIINADLTTGETEYKLSLAQDNCTVVSAVYDENGALISVKAESLEISAGIYERNVQNTTNAKKVKLMVLDNLYNLKPLCECDWIE